MQTKTRWIICAAALLFTFAPSAFSGESPDSLHISGAGLAPSDWTVAQIQQQLAKDITPITFASHGKPHVFNCVPLISLLKAAGAPVDFKMTPKADPKQKSYSLRFAAVTRGLDGYVVAFSFAELSPDIGNRHVWIALDEDGQPIPAPDGPIRLLSPDDQKPARGVHQLADITILDTAAATSRPADAP